MREISKRIQNYENMGLGLFIHWGLYSQLAQGEWTEYIHQIPQEKYEKLIDTFQPSAFDPQKIVAAAQDLGAKYIVLTTKHHEGFFLYDTCGLSSFDAMHSPAKRDLIKEFVAACHDAGILPFLYMATYDWHNPLYQTDFLKYLKYLQESVKILCTNYGKIGGFWFDGNWDKKTADWHLPELYGMIRHYQPEAIIINNTGLKNRGKISDPEIDVVTYERQTPDTVYHGQPGEKYVAGEVSLTLNQHWGFAPNDLNYKSPKEVIENIAHARQIGANILINIGLTGKGAIPAIQQNYLKLIGQWTKMAGKTLHEARPTTKIKANPNSKDFALVTDHHLYLFIHDLQVVGNSNVVLGGEGNNFRSFEGIDQPIQKISWLDNNENLAFVQDRSQSLLTLNASGFTYGSQWIVRIAQVDLK